MNDYPTGCFDDIRSDNTVEGHTWRGHTIKPEIKKCHLNDMSTLTLLYTSTLRDTETTCERKSRENNCHHRNEPKWQIAFHNPNESANRNIMAINW